MIPLNYVVAAFLFSCALYAFFLSLYTFRRMRPQKVGPALVLLMVASVFYSTGYGCEILSGDPAWTFAWLRVQYVGLAFMPYLILRLSLEFTGRYPARGKALLIPLSIGSLAFIAVQTNGLHGLFYAAVCTDITGPFPTSQLAKGPVYALHMTSFIVCCLVAFFVYVRSMLASRGIEQKRLRVLASTTVFPLISIVLYLFEIVPWHLDPSPISALLCCNLMVYGIQKTGLLELGHLARDLVFSSMHEGVIVTSRPETIADYNDAIKKIFPALARDARGMKLSERLPQLSAVLPADNESCDYMQSAQVTQSVGGAAPSDGSGSGAKPRGKARRKNDAESDSSRDVRYEIKNLPVVNARGQVLGNAYIFRDVTRERLYLETLKKRALIDGLTELYNRSYWEELALQALHSSAENGNECSFLMFDLDRFKDINDSFGHDAGDSILRSVSKRIRSSLREKDVAGRYGGDEFCVCLPNTGREECLAFSERLKKDVSSISISAGGVNTPVTISIGIAIAGCGDGATVTRCLSQADQALYRAKKSGRNGIACHEAG